LYQIRDFRANVKYTKGEGIAFSLCFGKRFGIAARSMVPIITNRSKPNRVLTAA
jgi:hypothetical protein